MTLVLVILPSHVVEVRLPLVSQEEAYVVVYPDFVQQKNISSVGEHICHTLGDLLHMGNVSTILKLFSMTPAAYQDMRGCCSTEKDAFRRTITL